MYNDDFDYGAAEADLEDCDCPWADEIYGYRSERGRDEFMRENGLNPDRYKHGSGSANGGSGTEGCFLTTACVVAEGLPDDCEALETLRGFRDGWLRKRAGGQLMVREYYEIAPRIVEKINARPDAEAIWKRMYAEQVLPCVETIKQGEYEAAFRMYRSWVAELKDRYLPPAPKPGVRENRDEIHGLLEELQAELTDFEQTRVRAPGSKEREQDLEWALHLEAKLRRLREMLDELCDGSNFFLGTAREEPRPLVWGEAELPCRSC